MNAQEPQEFTLDDILKEFGGEKPEKAAPPVKAPEAAEAPTLRMDPVQEAKIPESQTQDTVRLDTKAAGTVRIAVEEAPAAPREKTPKKQRLRKQKRNASRKEYPEEEVTEAQPQAYAPPQPIVFKPRVRAHEIKRKLVEGPEKRYFALEEEGVGKLQTAIFFSFLVVLVSAASTAMYALGMVQEGRLRLMVFGQVLSLLLSALIGSNQLLEGFLDLAKKKITLNTFLAVTFLVCLTDSVMCLKQVRVPCCAAFSLEVTMSLWSAYQRRATEMGQMDTMRKARNLEGLAAHPDYMDGKKGLLRKPGEVEDFMDHYAEACKPEKGLQNYGAFAIVVAFIIGACAGYTQIKAGGMNAGISGFLQVTAVSLLAAMPATAFICHSRPAAILERRLHRLGAVLCGWQGVEGLSGKAVFPVTYGDLFPEGTVRLNGMKFFGNRDPDQVLAYATAVIAEAECGLEDLFAQVLDSHNGRHYAASNLHRYESGGVGGTVEGEVVLLGSASFFREVGIEIPQDIKVSFAVYVAVDGELCGLFAVSYDKDKAVAGGLSTLTAYQNLQSVLISGDFMLTRGFLANKLGIKSKRFYLPEQEERTQLREIKPEKNAPTLLMTTTPGLAPLAYGVTGARALRTTCRLGTFLHTLGGLVGLGIMAVLVYLGSLELITPANMFLYQLVWMIPALLITEWVRSV